MRLKIDSYVNSANVRDTGMIKSPRDIDTDWKKLLKHSLAEYRFYQLKVNDVIQVAITIYSTIIARQPFIITTTVFLIFLVPLHDTNLRNLLHQSNFL